MSPILFQHGSEIRVLASTDVGKIPAIYCLHCGKLRRVRVSPDALRVV